jgi:5'(3')-deoxyribonucleotidase
LPELWHGSSEEISHKDDVFIRSSSGIFAADPIDDVVAVCEKLSLNCKLLVITAGQPWQCSLKLDWLRRHFPFIPSENVTFTDPEVGRHPNKSDACRDLGVDIYVEDRYDFARSIVGTSSRTNVLLIERYAWSHGEPHPRIHTVRNWQEAGQLLVDVTS